MEKVELTVKFSYLAEWATYYGWTKTDHQRYIFKDELGKTYIWNTTSFLYKELPDESRIYPQQGDVVKIQGFIKKESEYKGEPQTELTRVKLLEVVERMVTYEEKQAMKREEQLASLKDGDFVWNMPYRQYKAHYSDCETVAGSFRARQNASYDTPATISVIIREGRLKPSGTRGMHYSGYQMENELGERCTFRAVSEATAKKQADKEWPGHDWTCIRIYDYQGGRY